MSLGSLIQSIKNYNPEADFDLLEYAYKFGGNVTPDKKENQELHIFRTALELPKSLSILN